MERLAISIVRQAGKDRNKLLEANQASQEVTGFFHGKVGKSVERAKKQLEKKRVAYAKYVKRTHCRDPNLYKVSPKLTNRYYKLVNAH